MFVKALVKSAYTEEKAIYLCENTEKIVLDNMEGIMGYEQENGVLDDNLFMYKQWRSDRWLGNGWKYALAVSVCFNWASRDKAFINSRINEETDALG